MKREKKEIPPRDIQSIFGTEKKGPSKFFGFIQRDIFFYPYGNMVPFPYGKGSNVYGLCPELSLAWFSGHK